MSIITLNFGQCGTQLNQEFFTKISEDLTLLSNKKDAYYNQCVERWFYLNKNNQLEARAVLVDSSDKTTQLYHNTTLSYKFKSIITQPYLGSANNWALGYMECSKIIAKDVMNCVRVEAEKCDNLAGFLTMFSSSGGSGSGIGTFMLEKLQDEYANKLINSAIILPYFDGEICTQSYNSLLMLSKIYQIVDAILQFENQRLHYICNNYCQNKTVQIHDINELISQQLLSIYQPIGGINSVDLLLNACPNALFKLLEIKHAPLQPENTNNWKYLCGTIQRQSRFDYQYQNLLLKPKFITTTIISRGVTPANRIDFKSLIGERNSFVSWLPENESVQIYHQSNKIFNYDNFLTIISNNNHCCSMLNALLVDAKNLFNSKAYLHHYSNLGIDHDYFSNCFEEIGDIIDNYKKL